MGQHLDTIRTRSDVRESEAEYEARAKRRINEINEMLCRHGARRMGKSRLDTIRTGSEVGESEAEYEARVKRRINERLCRHGARRMGKSRLLKEWCRLRGDAE